MYSISMVQRIYISCCGVGSWDQVNRPGRCSNCGVYRVSALRYVWHWHTGCNRAPAIVFGLTAPTRCAVSLFLSCEQPRLLGFRFWHNERHSTASVPSGPVRKRPTTTKLILSTKSCQIEGFRAFREPQNVLSDFLSTREQSQGFCSWNLLAWRSL